MAPYQIFFPLGILNALIGVGLWIFQDLGFANPPASIHAKIMFGSFLWSFITGFLMTALPRMTGAKAAQPWETTFALILILMQMYQAWIPEPFWFSLTQALLVFFLMSFGAQRIYKSTKKIPIFFSHVGYALFVTLLGCYFYNDRTSLLGFHFYYVGSVLLLILGIGARFFSFLSGLPSVIEESNSLWIKGLFHSLGIALIVSLTFAGRGWTQAYLALFIITMTYLFAIWKIQRFSDRPSPLKYSVRLVALMIPLCFFLCWMQPHFYVTWFHLLFIGCFGLLTFSVATRVTLAHGSYPLDLEIKSPSLWIFLVCLILSLAFRIAYGLNVGGHLPQLHLAIFFWITAIAIWCGSFLSRIFKPGNLQRPSC